MFRLDELLNMKSEPKAIEHRDGLPLDRIGNTPYIIEKIIHRSNDCVVYIANHSISEQRVIVKELFPQQDFVYKGVNLMVQRDDEHRLIVHVAITQKWIDFKVKYLESLEAYAQIKDNHIVKMKEYFEANETVYAVFESIPYPTLNDLLNEKIINARQLMPLFDMLVQSVKSLHQKGLVYKALSPTKIFIGEKRIILSDFNPLTSNYFISERDRNIYIAPESRGYKPLTPAADVFSLGKILDTMFTFSDYTKERHHRLNGLNDSKYEYIMKMSSSSSPNNRLQTVDALMNLLYKREKKKRGGLSVLKIALPLILIGVAAYYVYDSGWLSKVSFKRDVPVIEASIVENSQLKAITQTASFDFTDEQVIRWADRYNEFEAEIEINRDLYRASITGKELNLKGFCLNPGQYTLKLSNPREASIMFDFKVNADRQLLEGTQPVINQTGYAYYEDQEQFVEWSYDGMAKAQIYHLNSNKIIDTVLTEDEQMLLTLSAGDYLLSVQGVQEDKRTLNSHAILKVYASHELMEPMLVGKDNSLMKVGEFIKWYPMEEGQVTIRLINESGTWYDLSESATTGEIEITEDIKDGLYQLHAVYTLDGRSSRVVNRTLRIVN